MSKSYYSHTDSPLVRTKKQMLAAEGHLRNKEYWANKELAKNPAFHGWFYDVIDAANLYVRMKARYISLGGSFGDRWVPL